MRDLIKKHISSKYPDLGAHGHDLMADRLSSSIRWKAASAENFIDLGDPINFDMLRKAFLKEY